MFFTGKYLGVYLALAVSIGLSRLSRRATNDARRTFLG